MTSRRSLSETNAIEVRDLSRRFGEFVAVDDCRSTCARGEIFGFLGSNGAGKSTTIRMLCGLLRPTSGTALVGGIDVGSDPEGVKRRIGYMSQRFSLYELLTVDQNIRFFGGLYGLDAAKLAERRRVRDRDGRPGRPRAGARARSRRRLAAAARARLRHPPRAADRVSRRADRRRRSAVAAAVLAAHRHALAAGRDRARHHALPRRGGALPSRRDDPRRTPRRARHDDRAQAGSSRDGRSSRSAPTIRWRRCGSSTARQASRRPACSAPPCMPCSRSEAVRADTLRTRLESGGIVGPVDRSQCSPSLEDVFLDVVEGSGGAAA